MPAASTDGQRIYAVGDVHGRSDLLGVIIDRVRDDLARRPHPQPHLVFLGDYVDRGPDSRGVLARLVALAAEERLPATFLLGNHDACLLAYLEDPDWTGRGLHWFHTAMGGAATLASYGVPDADEKSPAAWHGAFRKAFPAEHRGFLASCAFTRRIGTYLFVHAGIRPGVSLDEQEAEDLLWIREPFLSWKRDLGVKVVHGHTIVPFVEHHPNRIAIDTGAVRTGRLSCLVLEDADAGLLTTAGPTPLAVGAGLGLDRMQRRLAARFARLLPQRVGSAVSQE
jgi:serine/threonine protein phosphatase 1